MDQHDAAVSWHVHQATVRIDLAGEARDSARTNAFSRTVGTERTTTNSLFPFRSAPHVEWG